MKSLDETLEFIKRAHKNQFDKGGVEYWKHPVAVMNNLPTDATENEKQAALLHDVIEDTEYTKNDLKKLGYNDIVVNLVDGLSRAKGITYKDWIWDMCVSSERLDPSLIRIKIADMTHNMDPSRDGNLSAENRKILNDMIRKRYNPCFKRLSQALE